MRRLAAPLALVLLAGCRSTGQYAAERRALPGPTAAPAGIVIVADGAGDFRELSVNINEVIWATSTPLLVETFVWSHGYRRYLADQIDHDNHLAQGRRLAEYVCRHRQHFPNRSVFLLGNSAGCEVLLDAAAWLPPDSVDRIVLLAPSVCAYHDLRPALRAARGGIDVFTSHKDRLILGLGMRIVGTTERDCNTAAGRTGFRPVIANAQDAALYQRLRQHPWEQAWREHGHNGGHFGSTQPQFLRSHIVPLLQANEAHAEFFVATRFMRSPLPPPPIGPAIVSNSAFR